MLPFMIVILFSLASGYPSAKIVGGRVAPDGKYPYQASVQAFGSHLCGGSILNEKWILTAAHCFVSTIPLKLTVMVGSNNNTNGRVVNIKGFFMNPDFNRDSENDIALVRLAEPLTFDEKVKPIGIWAGDCTDINGRDLIVTGWGSTQYPNETHPDMLLELYTKGISTEECARRIHDNPVTEGHICTYSKVGEGACRGDSGGPLVDAETMTQVGIVSWGKPCAVGYPDVFTCTAAYKNWVDEIISAH